MTTRTLQTGGTGGIGYYDNMDIINAERQEGQEVLVTMTIWTL